MVTPTCQFFMINKIKYTMVNLEGEVRTGHAYAGGRSLARYHVLLSKRCHVPFGQCSIFQWTVFPENGENDPYYLVTKGPTT